jgi:hypothetical protein
MRKFELDNTQVRAPNASHLGFDKWRVKRGDVFSYSCDGQNHIARSLGCIRWCDSDGEDCRGWVCALVLGQCAEHAYIRWINPQWITQIINVPTKLAAFFFAKELPATVDMILKLADYGTLSEQFIDNASHHIAAWERGLSPAAFNALQAEK